MNVKATLTAGFAYIFLNASTRRAVSSIFACGAPAAFRLRLYAGSDQEASPTMSLSPCITKRRAAPFVRDSWRS